MSEEARRTLKASGLIKRFKRKTVVNNVSVEVRSGEVVGLLGPNGAGKTTTFYIMVGLLKPDRGEIFLDHQNLAKMPMYQRARAGIAYLAQEASVFRKLTAEENIRAILEATDLGPREQDERLEQLLSELGLKKVRDRAAYALSGGERRRVEIARALVLDPSFVLLDEPFAGIDPIAVGDIQDLVKGLTNRGIGVLVTDHNVRETLAICDRGYLLNAGEMLVVGTPEEILASDIAREVYLGKDFHV